MLRKECTSLWFKPRLVGARLRGDLTEGITVRSAVPGSPTANTGTPLRLLEEPVHLGDVLQRGRFVQADEGRRHDGRKLLGRSSFYVRHGLGSLLPRTALVHGLGHPVGVDLLHTGTVRLLLRSASASCSFSMKGASFVSVVTLSSLAHGLLGGISLLPGLLVLGESHAKLV